MSTKLPRVWLLLLFFLFCSSFSCATAQDNSKKWNVGTYDSQGQLHNSTEDAFRLSLSSFGAYFTKDKDVNLGFAIGPAKGNHSYELSLDIAPHHIGAGATWFPSSKSRYRLLRALSKLGAGAGLNYTYNTTLQKFEVGLKGTFIRW